MRLLRFEIEAQQRGWSLRRLAAEARFPLTTLYEIRNGDRNPRGHHMVRIAAALGVEPERAAELFEEVVE